MTCTLPYMLRASRQQLSLLLVRVLALLLFQASEVRNQHQQRKRYEIIIRL